ncbi:Serine/threonine-protein kinase PrkC [Neorhodopirellula pilleata]|uniref:Serine/threonine-protein kinase PrkC n=2 Tax=Neorhodopirellula pilleata TaxID=2714738 RepID=A0A5C6ADN3_9BACT|nr:Serine/threonine-protein kinase PrkC [Neorhodopirellula pilleata]
MGAVFLVHDTELSSDVALKLLPRVNAKTLARFKREFRSLANIVHPNLVSLYELISDGDQWYFTMEYVQGSMFNAVPLADTFDTDEANAPTSEVDLATREATSTDLSGEEEPTLYPPVLSNLDWDSVRQAYAQLAAGIEALHSFGKIHRDIKPSNVMMRENGQVVILDFGLIAEGFPISPSPESDAGGSSSWRSDSHEGNDEVVGTVRYMSPECAAGGSVTAASDWYAIGVMLYETLVGKPPFSGRLLKVLSLKQRMVPTPVAELVPGVPEDLAKLCDQLLSIDPNDRPDYPEIVQVLGKPPTSTVKSVVPKQIFVGRSAQQKQLQTAFKRAKSGHRVSVVVSGESGFGKTAAVENFLEHLKSQPSIIISGRCFEQESVPFKTLDSLVDSLSRYLNGLTNLELARLIPRHAGKLGRLFPVMSQISGFDPGGANDDLSDREARRLAFEAFSELLARIGDIHPLILSIDDLQWGDSDSVEAIRELICSKTPARILMIASHRSEYPLPDGYAQLFDVLEKDWNDDFNRVSIGPLNRQESEDVISGYLKDERLPPDTIDRIISEAQGSPLFLQQLVQYFLDFPSRSPGQTLGLNQVILGRVETLDTDGRRFLEMLAIVGKPTPLAALLRGIPEIADPQHIVAELRSEKLLSGAAAHAADNIQIYHDRVRESIVQSLPTEQKQDCHLRWAKFLLTQPDSDPESLAVHFRGGGDFPTAGTWYAIAAEASAKALAFDHAAYLYEQSLALKSVDADEELKLRSGLAQAYVNAGRGKHAAEQYLCVAELSEPSQRANLKAMAAGQLCISGNIDLGLSTFAEVLKSYRLKLPTKRNAILIDLLGQRARLKLGGLRIRTRPADEQDPAQLQRIDSLWGIAAGLSTVNNIAGAALQTRLLCESLKSGDAHRIARSLAWEAFMVSTSGKYLKAASLLKNANRLAEESGNPHALGVCLMVKGLIEFQEAKFTKSVASLQVAEDHFRTQSIGGWWERSTIRWIQGTCLLHAGDMDQVQAAMKRDFLDARERGDLYALTNMQAFLIPFLDLSKGDLDHAHESIRLARASWNHSGFHYQHLQSSFIECLIALYNGEGEKALATLETFWPNMKSALVLHNKFVRVMMVDTRATCTLAAADQSPQRQALLRTAEALAKSLRREGDAWSNVFANRILGGVAKAQGDNSNAIKYWKDAKKGFEEFEMKLHVGSVGMALATVLPTGEADTARREAEQTFAACGVAATHSFGNCLTWCGPQ